MAGVERWALSEDGRRLRHFVVTDDKISCEIYEVP